MLHRLRDQSRGILVQNDRQYAGGTGAASLWPPARPDPPENDAIFFENENSLFAHKMHYFPRPPIFGTDPLILCPQILSARVLYVCDFSDTKRLPIVYFLIDE